MLKKCMSHLIFRCIIGFCSILLQDCSWNKRAEWKETDVLFEISILAESCWGMLTVAVAGSTPQWDMKKPVERPTLVLSSGFATFFSSFLKVHILCSPLMVHYLICSLKYVHHMVHHIKSFMIFLNQRSARWDSDADWECHWRHWIVWRWRRRQSLCILVSFCWFLTWEKWGST